jgi:hypothetical protein
MTLELVGEGGRQAAAVPLEPAEQATHRAAGNLDAEVVRGHILQVVGFVQDEAPVRRQDRRLLPVVGSLTHRQVGRKEMVVDHHHVRLRRPAARPKQEAPVEVGTLEAGAQVRFRAHLVPDFSGRGHRQVTQCAVHRVARPFRNAKQLVELVLLQQGPLGRYRLVHSGQTEVIPPAFEQGEGGGVLLVRKRPAQQRKVLPDQLLLKIDGVGAHHGALSVGASPGERRHQVGEGLAHPGPRLQQLHSAVVVGIGDVGRHVALALAVLVAGQLTGDRPPLAEGVDHLVGIQPNDRTVLGDFHDDVQRGGIVIENAEPHTGIVQLRRHVKIGGGRLQHSARVVMEQHLPPARPAGKREHHVDGAPGGDPGCRDHTVAVHCPEKRNLSASGRGDLAGEVGPNAGRQTVDHVFSSFFFAAGKSTLLRISR